MVEQQWDRTGSMVAIQVRLDQVLCKNSHWDHMAQHPLEYLRDERRVQQA